MEWVLLHSRGQGWDAPFPPWDGERTLILVFGGSRLDPGPLEALRHAFPGSFLLGCSSAGEILDAHLADDTFSVAIVRFDHTDLRLASLEDIEADRSREAGRHLGAALVSEALAGVFVLSDGLRVNGSKLVQGLGEHLDVPITGGLAGDGQRFRQSWVLSATPGSELKRGPGRLAAVGLYGPRIHIGSGSQGGWLQFGPERKVTRAIDNVLYELDGRPALALYRTYLGDLAAGLPATALRFPLSLRTEDPLEPQVVRTILAIDEASQSLTFAGDIPEGASVALMRCELDRLIEGAQNAASLARPEAPGPVLSLAVSCVGRRMVLGERSDEELEATLSALPPGSGQIGFYSYGELSPVLGGGCRLHNQTMTLTTLQER